MHDLRPDKQQNKQELNQQKGSEGQPIMGGEVFPYRKEFHCHRWNLAMGFNELLLTCLSGIDTSGADTVIVVIMTYQEGTLVRIFLQALNK
jgi:hypothetical protein